MYLSGIWDGLASRRGFWCLFPEMLHLETRKGISNAILKVLFKDCSIGKAVFQGEECNRPKEIHDTRDFGAFSYIVLRMETPPWLSQEKQMCLRGQRQMCLIY